MIQATEETLKVQLDERFDVHVWKGEFTSKYIEEISRKTGRERSFAVFMQLLMSGIQNQKGSSQVYIDILGYQDLQLLKAKRSDENTNQQQIHSISNNKRYLILTHIIKDTKVHYPLPLNPLEQGLYQLDKETMKNMVKRMSQTLTEFRSMNISSQNHTQNSGFSNVTYQGRQTAKEFFSKENIMHPVVEDNQKLKQRLQQLDQARSMGGAVGLNDLLQEKNQIDNEFQQFRTMTEKELKRMLRIKTELSKDIEDTMSEITSERPQSSQSQQMIHNQTLTSNFSNAAEVEELRKKLAESSVELEEIREQNKKRIAFQQKDIEEYYTELSQSKQEEKALRIRMNQLENQLEQQIKRLDIICKTKGLPRPQRKSSRGPTNYVSPYRQGTNGSTDKKPRINSNSVKRPSPIRSNYSPLARKPLNYSPGAQSNGSGYKNGLKTNNYSPGSWRNKQSPGARSNASGNSSQNATNRLYSPSGRIRQGGSGTRVQGQTVNRVRKEPAVSGSFNANSRSNSRQREPENVTPTNLRQQNSNKSATRIYGGNNKATNRATNANSNKQISALQVQPSSQTKNTTLFSNQQSKINTAKVLTQQKAVNQVGSIDEKIDRLQSLLKMVKSNIN